MNKITYLPGSSGSANSAISISRQLILFAPAFRGDQRYYHQNPTRRAQREGKMKTDRRRLKWHNSVPKADVVLRESVMRATARDPRSWGFLLSRVRAARGWSLADQAMALGVTESALVFLSVCRLPRAGRCEEDVAAVADRMGVHAAALWFVLDLAAEAEAGNGCTVAGGAA